MSEYIMNRESLKQHCEAMCHKFKDIPTSGTYEEHRLILELLEQTEWISCSERLPKDDGLYLVYTEEQPFVCPFKDNEFFIDEVLAWMSLPKPYEPQEGANECIKIELSREELPKL